MAPASAQTTLATPTKPATKPEETESPGTWQHPRLQEITRRRRASTFTEKNMRHIVINLSLLVVLFVVRSFVLKALPSKRSAPQLWDYVNFGAYALAALPLYNIAVNAWPLVRAEDDLSDVALTPGQRKLLGLPPSSAPPTPGSVYSTPPRYTRTPSNSGSPASRLSFSASPASNRSPSIPGTPTPAGNPTGSHASPGNQLLQKAMLGARRSSLGSLGSPSPKASISTGASLFGNGFESPSPSPAGKRSSVGLSNKWRYERGIYEKTKGFHD
ncbi:NPCC-domain-containing protein [Xylariaceae sp. FL0594]|nr:NPCC-domain-containing protein [Xylariaceae sp. FL0594]